MCSLTLIEQNCLHLIEYLTPRYDINPLQKLSLPLSHIMTRNLLFSCSFSKLDITGVFPAIDQILDPAYIVDPIDRIQESRTLKERKLVCK